MLPDPPQTAVLPRADTLISHGLITSTRAALDNRPDVVATTEPFVEETWQGERIAVGGAELELVERVPRCRMIDVDQDGATADGRWLKRLAAERDMFLAMYASVVKPATIALGDDVRLT